MLRLIKLLFVLTLLTAGALSISIHMFLLQDDPLLEAAAPPTPEDVVAARQLLRDLRRAANNGSGQNSLLLTDASQLNSVIRLGSRMVNGFRGRIDVQANTVAGQISVPVSLGPYQKWLNISGRIPAFRGDLLLDHLTVGSTPVPGRLAMEAARIAANIGVGNQFGDKVVQSVTELAVAGDQLQLRIALDEVGKNGVMRGAVSQLRGADMPSQAEIEVYHDLIRTAMEDGRLKPTGSFLPYLQFTLEIALQRSTPETLPNVYTAAIFGLTKACGARDFSMIVGRLAFDKAAAPKDWSVSCSDVTFNNRIDSRRHFVTAAALQAASNTGVAVSIGEFKELYDSISGAGGFDFTDMAANLSGIRMSDVFYASPRQSWPALITRLRTENDVIVPFEGIPQIMTEAAFKERYSNVDSAAYDIQITDIEARIDKLGLYAEN